MKSIEINTFSFKKMHFKMSSGIWRPFVSASMCWYVARRPLFMINHTPSIVDLANVCIQLRVSYCRREWWCKIYAIRGNYSSVCKNIIQYDDYRTGNVLTHNKDTYFFLSYGAVCYEQSAKYWLCLQLLGQNHIICFHILYFALAYLLH